MFKFYKLKPAEYPIFLLWMFIASLYIRPYNSIMAPLYNIGNYCVFMYSFYAVLNKWKYSNNTLKIIYLILVVSIFYLVLSRLLNGYGYNFRNTSTYLYDIALVGLFSFGMLDKTWAKLKGFSLLLMIYIIINFYTIIRYPDGLYENDLYTSNWFLGYKNVLIRTILPGVVLNLLCSIHDFGKPIMKDVLLILVALCSVILADSSTSIIMICVFIVGVIYWSLKRRIYNLSLIKCFAIISCISIAFTIFSFQSFLSSIVEQLFEKDATFTGRSYVWAFTLGRLMESPIIGFGWHTTDEWRDVLGYFGIVAGFSHPHNFILYTLLQGGILYLSLFVFLCFYISKKCPTNNEYLYVLTLMYLTFFVEGITESLTGTVLFFPMFCLYALLKNK